MTDFRDLADALLPHVLRAGRIVMSHFRKGGVVTTKSGGSPVTAADHEAEAVLLAALASAAPGVPVVAEEMMEGKDAVATGDEFVLVDPLDGTKEFIAERGEFTINIGLIRDRTPCFGLIYAPAMSLLYVTPASDMALAATVAPDADVTRLAQLATRPLRTRSAANGAPLTILASRSHGSAALGDWLKRINVGGLTTIGSSLKFCQVAEGKADVYPRFGPTKEWDTAAGHAILSAAGGVVTERDGTPLLYGKHEANFLNPSFIAAARRIEGLYDARPQ